MATFNIRLARPGDARAMSLLSRDHIELGLGWRWTPWRVEAAVRDRDINALVACDGPRVIGMAVMQYLEEQAHLMLLAVVPDARRRGVGRALLAWLEASAVVAGIGRIDLEVRASSREAQAFYRELGFIETARVAGYYSGRETALRMCRALRVVDGLGSASLSAHGPVWRPPT